MAAVQASAAPPQIQEGSDDDWGDFAVAEEPYPRKVGHGIAPELEKDFSARVRDLETPSPSRDGGNVGVAETAATHPRRDSIAAEAAVDGADAVTKARAVALMRVRAEAKARAEFEAQTAAEASAQAEDRVKSQQEVGAEANAQALADAEAQADAELARHKHDLGSITAPEKIVLGGEKWPGANFVSDPQLSEHACPQAQARVDADSADGGEVTGPTDSTESQDGAVLGEGSPLRGFDTLDDVQRYAVGALSVVLLMPPETLDKKATDLNALAFSRALSLRILAGLGLRQGQQTALLALEPDRVGRAAVMDQCVELVGDEAARFCVVQAMLALAVAGGVYDARSRAFLLAVAKIFRVEWSALAAVELAIAIQLLEEVSAAEESSVASEDLDEVDVERKDDFATGFAGKKKRRTAAAALADRRRRKQKARKAMKVSGITLVGGLLFGVTGGLIAPALLSALAGVGLASAAGLASAGTVASGAAVGSLFGVGGMAISGKKAHRRMSDVLDEFDFETKDDERVVEARARRKEREEAKARKEAEKIRAMELNNGMAASNSSALAVESPRLLAIEGAPERDSMDGTNASGSTGGTSRGELEQAGAETTGFANDPAWTEGNEDSRRREVEKFEGEVVSGGGERFDAPPVLASLSGDDAPNPPLDNSEAIDGELDEFPDEGTSGKKGPEKHGRKGRTVDANGLDSVGAVPGLHVCICVPGWLQGRSFGSALDQFEDALNADIPCSQHVAMRWESRRLYEMSLAFAKFWASKATVSTIQQAYPHAIAAASSVAGAVAFAFALPLTVVSCLDYIDNPWSILLSRANAAGEALADVLMERSYGQRPVSLVGYSLGARVIFKCLESLAERGALGIVDNVFLLGAPVTADPERWKKIVPVVAGRVVQGYMGMDWALAYFHRGCGHGVYVAGLRRVECEGVENFDMSLLGMEGHRELKDALPRVLRAMGTGSGFISMPPAPLVKRKKSRSRKSTDGGEEIIVDVDDDGSKSGSKSRLSGWRTAVSESRNSSPPPAYVDVAPTTLQLTNGGGDVSSFSSAPEVNLDLQWGDDVELASVVAKETKDAKIAGVDGTPGEKDEKKKKRRGPKGPKWLSSLGVSWGTSSSSSKKPPTGADGCDTDTSQSKSAESTLSASGELPTATNPDSTTSDFDSQEKKVDSPHGDGLDAEDGAGEGAVNGGGPGSFDWELQRCIWEEQERQLRENGIANASVDFESSTKVVLGIGVELTGRRLRNFISQDTELPAPTSADVFTNCIDEQEAVTFRLYEHEKRTKFVPLNTCLPGHGKYPKLIGELSLRWSSQASKGKLRFAISVAVDEAGDVVARAEERLREGGVGETAELTVKRADLCTMGERRELEAAENRRLAAEAAAAAAEDAKKKDLLLEASPHAGVLALPAPDLPVKIPGHKTLHVGNSSSTAEELPVKPSTTEEVNNRRKPIDPFEGR